MTRDEIKTVTTKLWRKAESEGASVIYATGLARGRDPLTSEGGSFYQEKNIDVWRHGYDEKQMFEPHWYRNNGVALSVDELRDELCALAHEYGHFRSFVDGTWALMQPHLAAFQTAQLAGVAVAAVDYAEVLAEEMRAWETARITLETLGFSDWVALEVYRSRCLQTYVDTPHT